MTSLSPSLLLRFSQSVVARYPKEADFATESRRFINGSKKRSNADSIAAEPLSRLLSQMYCSASALALSNEQAAFLLYAGALSAQRREKAVANKHARVLKAALCETVAHLSGTALKEPGDFTDALRHYLVKKRPLLEPIPR